MPNIEKKCEDRCPKCDSTDIEWHGSEICDKIVVYSASCKTCKTDFTEEYTLHYAVSVCD